MNTSANLPVVRLNIDRRSGHPWIFQRMVDKPEERLPPGSIVDVVDRSGNHVGRGFYSGRARIALRILTTQPEQPLDDAFFAARVAAAVQLRREVLRLDEVSDAWRVIHSEGDGLSGVVVDRFGDTLVVEYFSAGMYRLRALLRECLREHFPDCIIHELSARRVQKQESFDHDIQPPPAPVVISEYGARFHVEPGGSHKTGFFTDQRDNRHQLARFCKDQRVLDLCCNSGGFAVHAALAGAREVVGVDIDEQVLELARRNATLNNIKAQFEQADVMAFLRQLEGQDDGQFDVVVLDPPKMTRDRREVIPALKRYATMNKAAMGAVRPGGLFLSCSCTGLVSEEQFLDMLRRAASYAGREVQVLALGGAGADHPFLAQVPESRYLNTALCRIN